jgi:hypothetical protein
MRKLDERFMRVLAQNGYAARTKREEKGVTYESGDLGVGPRIRTSGLWCKHKGAWFDKEAALKGDKPLLAAKSKMPKRVILRKAQHA